MLALVLGVLTAATPLTPATLEQHAVHQVLQEFERVGRRSPESDASLTQAARQLAREALEEGASGPLELLSLTEAVSDAGGADPTPRFYVIRASTPEQALDTLEARKDLSEEPASRVGVGAWRQGERTSLVVLLAWRRATLVSFPRTFEKAGMSQTLCGQFESSLHGADVYVTQPEGRVEHPSLVRQVGSSFCARLVFPTEGEYTVEVVGHGDKGPEVASLFLVDVGRTRPRGQRERLVEPTTVPEARLAVLERINALRRAYAAEPLVLDEALVGVAQAYSERMAREGFFAHVAPDGSDLRGRMSAAGVKSRSVGENLGQASGPLTAHFGIEHSPGHRGNLLMSQYRQAGIGVVFQKVEGRDQVVLTEVFATPPPVQPVGDPRLAAYHALAAHRASHGLPPLVLSPELERIAQDHARRTLELDSPRAELPGPNLHARIFQALEDASTASVDVYVFDSPTLLPDSRNLAERKNDRVGVGMVRGDSRTYGKDQYWMVVIYAATQ